MMQNCIKKRVYAQTFRVRHLPSKPGGQVPLQKTNFEFERQQIFFHQKNSHFHFEHKNSEIHLACSRDFCHFSTKWFRNDQCLKNDLV